MKFTKEDAFKSLEGYLTDNGRKPLLLSKRSVEKQIEALMPLLAGEETELSAFVEQVKGTFRTMQDNLRYDNSQFVRKWEEEHPQQGGTPATEPQAGEQGGAGRQQPETDALRQLQEKLDRLEKNEAERLRAEAAAAKRREIAEAMARRGAEDSEWVRDFLNEVSIGEDADAEASAEKYLKIYNKGRASAIVPGAAPGAAGVPGKPAGAVPESLVAAAQLMRDQDAARKAALER